VRLARQMAREGFTYRFIATCFGLSLNSIKYIINKVTYKDVY